MGKNPLMTLEDEFLKGLETLIEWRGEKFAPLSKRSGMGETAIRDLFRKRSVPKVSNAKAIADALSVSLDDVFAAARGVLPGDADASGPLFPSIPRLNARLSAGHGSLNSDYAEVLDRIPFTEGFVRHKLGRSNINGLVCIDAHGESMEPTIGDGDLLIVDTEHQDLAAGIYAVNFENESYVKRVEKVGEGFSLVSDNRAYVPISVRGPNLGHFEVVGKVLWAGRMF